VQHRADMISSDEKRFMIDENVEQSNFELQSNASLRTEEDIELIE
jgi:hypothetical protein